MPQPPQVSVSVNASVAGLAEAITAAAAAFSALNEALREDCGVDELLWDEITRLRQELNSTRDELRRARADLQAERDKWAAWPSGGTDAAGNAYPMVIGGSVSVMGTATPSWVWAAGPGWTSSHPDGAGGSGAYWPAGGGGGAGSVCTPGGAGVYTVSTNNLSALGLPGTLTITSSGGTETMTVTNVTFDGVSYSVGCEPA